MLPIQGLVYIHIIYIYDLLQLDSSNKVELGAVITAPVKAME